MTGAYITIGGAVLTIILNILLIPVFRYTGAAWSTFFCYTFMMVISYVLGQKYYPIPYAKKKLLTYIGIVVLMYIFHEVIVRNLSPDMPYFQLVYYSTSLLLMAAFAVLILKVERAEFARMPVIGRYFASSH